MKTWPRWPCHIKFQRSSCRGTPRCLPIRQARLTTSHQRWEHLHPRPRARSDSHQSREAPRGEFQTTRPRYVIDKLVVNLVLVIDPHVGAELGRGGERLAQEPRIRRGIPPPQRPREPSWGERSADPALSALATCRIIWAGEMLMAIHPSVAAWISWSGLDRAGEGVKNLFFTAEALRRREKSPYFQASAPLRLCGE